MGSQLVQFYCCVCKKVLLLFLFTSQRSDLIKGVLCPAAVLALQLASGQKSSLALGRHSADADMRLIKKNTTLTTLSQHASIEEASRERKNCVLSTQCTM